jgi:hypothetical protein
MACSEQSRNLGISALRALDSIGPIGIMSLETAIALVQRNCSEQRLEAGRTLISIKNLDRIGYRLPEELKHKTIPIKEGEKIKAPNFIILGKHYEPEQHPVSIHTHIVLNDRSQESEQEMRFYKGDGWSVGVIIEFDFKQ